jgi:DNA-binding transcriptional LysR family regulator
LRLSHSSTVSISGHLLRRISTYLDQQNGVSLDIGKLSSEAQLEELAEGRLDMACCACRCCASVRAACCLFTERLLLAVPNEHRLADSPAVELAQLKDERSSIPHPQRGGLSYLCRPVHASGLFPKAARVMSRKTTQLQLIQAGFGVALLPESMQDIAPVGVRFLPLSDPDCQSTVALAYRQNPALVQHFIQTFATPVGAE